jgi:hypothetical protein
MGAWFCLNFTGDADEIRKKAGEEAGQEAGQEASSNCLVVLR